MKGENGSKIKMLQIFNALVLQVRDTKGLCIVILLLFFVTTSCALGSGKFYEWCKKREFPAICKKYF